MVLPLIVNLKNFFTALKKCFNVFQAPSVFALEYIHFTFLQEMQAHIDKINEMASVMRKAIEVDEGRICEDEERIKQLEVKKGSKLQVKMATKVLIRELDKTKLFFQKKSHKLTYHLHFSLVHQLVRRDSDPIHTNK